MTAIHSSGPDSDAKRALYEQLWRLLLDPKPPGNSGVREYLSSANETTWVASLDAAISNVASGRATAFLIPLVRWVLAFDVDPEPPADVPVLQALVLDFVRAIHSAGLRCLVNQSGTPGGYHVLVPFTDKDQLLLALAAHRTMSHLPTAYKEFRVRNRDGGGALRPPGSPHRLGYATGLVEPSENFRSLTVDELRGVVDEWAVLASTCATWVGIPIPLQRSQPPPSFGGSSDPYEDLARLGPRLQRALLKGPEAAGYNHRHTADIAICLSARNAGLSEEQLLRIYELDLPGTAKFRETELEKGYDAARDYLAKKYAAAERYEQDNPAFGDVDAVRAELRRWWASWNHMPWPGKRGLYEWLVLRALFDKAIELGTSTPFASRARILQTVPNLLSDRTLDAALGRLQRDGGPLYLLHRGGYDNGPNQWGLSPPPAAYAQSAVACLLEEENARTTTASSFRAPCPDLWIPASHGGFGLFAQRVYEAIHTAEGSVTVTRLARRFSTNDRRVREVLTKFEQEGMGRLTADGWLLLAHDLSAIACRRGVAGLADMFLQRNLDRFYHRGEWVRQRERAIAKARRPSGEPGSDIGAA